ncbi:ABC transporter permease [Arcanobacterium ihumii]|uniref:ABC transporter permease n=1 Tax=Arcanobacterium ihumii TaxID=2138162 RepID=UPI000F53382B|nr:ABC transporter permease [Arcanobacterium ihumii]
MSDVKTKKVESPHGHSLIEAWIHTSLRSGWLVAVLAVILAFVVGAILIAISGANVFNAYYAMFRGAIFDPGASTFQRQIMPLTKSLFNAIPLILAGLGLGIGFRAGLFNIGGTGQIVFGAIAAIWVGVNLQLPAGVHMIVAILAAIVAGGLYAGIAGLLKARTGANEVIVTIMLNTIAALILSYLLSLPSWKAPGSNNPQTPHAAETALYLPLLPPPFKLHIGLIIALLATFVYWWILKRSTFGFELRAVGANPNAALTAGMSTAKVTTLTLIISGAFCGLAGANEALGTMGYVTEGVAGSIGFDAITVALLGRNTPLGIFFAGLLFGGFKAGGYVMQTQGVPIDMILILQSMIVLFIAAPALIRWMFRLPKPDGKSIREYMATLSEKSEASRKGAQA